MALIKKEFIDKIICESDIVSIISEYLKLKKEGVRYRGLSPFNKENTPSFYVSPVKQMFTDYSSGKGGNVLNFIQEITPCSFPDAIKIVAEKINKEVEYESKEYSEKEKEKIIKIKALQPALDFSLRKYIECLKNKDASVTINRELKEKRKYSDNLIIDWQIGYAPGNKFLYNKLAQKKQLAEGKELGLVSENNDKYFNRIIYPLHNDFGKLVGFAGRSLSDVKTYPKWINPSESVLYQKHNIWYGLYQAKREISTKNSVWVVEGYNDVIAWHENGLINTVGSCGTAITKNQLNQLKKYCSQIIFCMDGDSAGLKSTLKHVPIFIENGFTTKVVILPEKLDPDEFVRENATELKHTSLDDLISKNSIEKEGFTYLMEEKMKGTSFEVQEEGKNLCLLLSKIEKKEHLNVYTKMLSKHNDIGVKDITHWIKEFKESNKLNVKKNSRHEKYPLPKGVNTPLSEIEKIIDIYGIFIEKDCIWSLKGGEGNFSFQKVSNFSIEIIQHMLDEKTPMKLIRIKNIHGIEKVFDVLSENLNTPQRFDNTVTSYGNFLWSGTANDFNKLRHWLFDNMGNGRKIDVLGWQPDNFWVWNNEITLPTGEDIMMDNNGIFKLNKVSYYVPSANEVYKNNPFKFEPQKKLITSNKKYSFEEYSSKILRVHGNHGIAGVLFSIASIFQDYIEKEVGGFPILFLFGVPSTGKDQLAFCCQSFFGTPQTAINLEGGASTIKGQIRTFAQLSNIICHLSEYKRGNSQIDGVLKGIWDKRGYVRGNIDSHVGTDNVPILCSAILTGNEHPNNDALITRLIWAEMTKVEFTPEDVSQYINLTDMIKNGVSHITKVFIKRRAYFIENFKQEHKTFKTSLQKRLPKSHSRMQGNAATLGAVYALFKDEVVFPFSYKDVMDYLESGIEIQMRKLDSTNIITKFWDCFLASMRGHKDIRINNERELKVDGNTLSIQFSHCYLRVQKEWNSLYQEPAPSKGTVGEALKKDEAFLKATTIRLAKGKSGNSTSVYQFDLTKISVSEDIITAVNWQQEYKETTQGSQSNEGKKKLPF